ncbi:MAG: Sulfurtransferase [uncultured Sulfurovum sp.]|uniref:Sulfurtransferase n=1 Tax=uncultured Sulfurovum sp. TaxID=269237 RepID=A0A6S6SL03_9BACT|nr:MAG: Sulfurtransferase [uncultured Sulfurovum sp.]
MKRFIVLILLGITISFLQASENIFISPKVALKMINKKDVLFISLDKNSLEIKNSKQINMDFLISSDILGRLSCSSFYGCSKKIEKYFSSLGIENNHPLILYDNSYGIQSATFYGILESIGHTNMAILRGGIEDIMNLDPNWKLYSKYLNELDGLVDSIQKDVNQTRINDFASQINDLEKKIRVLEPHLLVDKSNSNFNNSNTVDSNYTITKTNQLYSFSKKDLVEILKANGQEDSNNSIIDVCTMHNLLGKDSHTGIKFLSWKRLIDKESRYLKSNETLEVLFRELGLTKTNHNYLYCMSGVEKAFFMMMALREVGYTKTKVFRGDWNTWVGDIDE